MALRKEAKRQNTVRIALIAASAVALAYMGIRSMAGWPAASGAPTVSAGASETPPVPPPETRGGAGFVLRGTMRLDDAPTALAFAQTGGTLAAGLRDGRIETWDVVRGKRIASLQGPRGEVAAITIASTAKRVGAVDADGAAYLWDATAGSAPKSLANERPAHLVRFSEDGERLAVVADDGSVQVLDLETSESWSFPGSQRVPKALAFSPAGPMMAVSESGKIALWGVGLTDAREQLRASGPEAEAIAFSANGLELAAGVGRQVVTWDMPTRRPSRQYTLSGQVRALAHAGDQGWVAVTDGPKKDELRVWRVNEGRSMSSIVLPRPAQAIALSSRGERLAVATAEGEVYYWEALAAGER